MTILIIGGILTSLIAGLFFGFSVAVNGALHQLKDNEYMRAMQAINRVIMNPVFLLTFMAPVVLLPWAAVLLHGTEAFGWVLAAAAFYVIGTFGVTMAGNMPLNDQLDKFDSDKASSSEFAAARKAFEHPWNRLHTIRTIAPIIATVLLFIAVAVS